MIASNILLVDDDDVAVEAMLRSMKKANIQHLVTVAEDGQVAIDILRGQHPTRKIKTPVIVLLDINMPRLNGFEFLDIVRSDPALKHTIIFMLTTSNDESDRIKAYNKNIAGYITKSAVGHQFKNLFQLLESYAKAVSLPP